MGAFGTLNGRKVYPSFCSNSRYYCTVYKDKIPRPVFNIDNPWINIFLPVCQSRKCQRWAGRHPRAGSLPFIRGCAPPALDAGWAGGEPPLSPCGGPTFLACRDHGEVRREMCPQVITTWQLPHLHAVASAHRGRSGPPQDQPKYGWQKHWGRGLGANPRRCKGLQPHAGLHGAPRPSPRRGATPGAPSLSIPGIGLHIAFTQLLTHSCPWPPSKTIRGEIRTMLQNISGSCVHPPLKLGETGVSPQDLCKPRPLKNTAEEFQRLFC